MGREAQIKKWSRSKKEALINKNFDNLKRLSISNDHLTCSVHRAFLDILSHITNRSFSF